MHEHSDVTSHAAARKPAGGSAAALGADHPVMQLQRLIGNRATAAAVAGATARRSVTRAARPLVQRDMAGDLKAAHAAIDLHHLMDEQVLPRLKHEYTETSQLAQHSASGLGDHMASGLKAWAENFKNKSGAYLAEAQKAMDHTDWYDGRFAVLGVNTHTDPDVSEVRIDRGELDPGKAKWAAPRALEVKSSDSGHEAVAALVREGIKQLKERENKPPTVGVGFTRHLLAVHLNAPGNYPFTDDEFAVFQHECAQHDVDPYEFSHDGVAQQWNARLFEKVSNYVEKQGFNNPVEVRMYYRGRRYATTRVG